MEGANLWGARMEGADLRRSRIFGLTHRVSALTPNLSASTNEGGAIRLVDLSDAVWDAETDFRDAFLDASVTVPDAFTTRMGSPCQWVDTRLSDTEFMSVWAWWLDQLEIGRFLQPSDIRNIPRPAPDRLAELGLTDCKPNQPFGPMPASD
jgi:alcohol dehydrogenase YqhD (iron-dependent ADH family)